MGCFLSRSLILKTSLSNRAKVNCRHASVNQNEEIFPRKADFLGNAEPSQAPMSIHWCSENIFLMVFIVHFMTFDTRSAFPTKKVFQLRVKWVSKPAFFRPVEPKRSHGARLMISRRNRERCPTYQLMPSISTIIAINIEAPITVGWAFRGGWKLWKFNTIRISVSPRPSDGSNLCMKAAELRRVARAVVERRWTCFQESESASRWLIIWLLAIHLNPL